MIFHCCAGLKLHTHVLWSRMSGRISCLPLLVQDRTTSFTALTFQVWTSTWPQWCLCRVGSPLLFRNDHSCMSLISWPGWCSTCKWHFSITSLGWPLGCHRWLDFCTTDQRRKEKAALMEKPHTTSLQLHMKLCIFSFELALRDTHCSPKQYCRRGNCRDLQIAGNFEPQACLPSACSLNREKEALGKCKTFTSTDSNLLTSWAPACVRTASLAFDIVPGINIALQILRVPSALLLEDLH